MLYIAENKGLERPPLYFVQLAPATPLINARDLRKNNPLYIVVVFNWLRMLLQYVKK